MGFFGSQCIRRLICPALLFFWRWGSSFYHGGDASSSFAVLLWVWVCGMHVQRCQARHVLDTQALCALHGGDATPHSSCTPLLQQPECSVSCLCSRATCCVWQLPWMIAMRSVLAALLLRTCGVCVDWNGQGCAPTHAPCRLQQCWAMHAGPSSVAFPPALGLCVFGGDPVLLICAVVWMH